MLNINSNYFGNLHPKSTQSFFAKTFYFFVLLLCIGLRFPSGLHAQTNEPVTNKTIIDLSKAGIGKQIILAKIENSICNFDLSTDGLIALKKSGVPDDIVATMISKGSTPAQAPNDQSQNNNTQDQNAQAGGDQNAQAIPTANTAPPELPTYEQPPCPVDGYLWVPGYWAFNPVNGYYWVPGVWVAPPDTGLLWTPAYWGFNGIAFVFHPGYWGARVGFYGGINYGYGYGGYGFVGGSWSGRYFRYNTAVVRVNTTVIHNTYVDRTV
ncbi:MAG: YXWGXW repeat-containing protein, partial [Mucilaginibacter sp.]